MSEKHLATGAALPPLAKNTLRLYSMRYCPFGQRTRLVLAHKQILFETVNINSTAVPKWYFNKHPLGLVPTLEFDDKIIYESAICNEYLDEMYATNRMMPTDPYQKARARMLIESFSEVTSVFYSMMKSPEEAAKEAVSKALDRYEKALTAKFFGGDSPGMIDAHIWPWFERFPTVKEIIGFDILSADRYPKLKQWFEDMLVTPMVRKSYLSPEKHTQFVRTYLSGEMPDYDA